MTCWRSECRPGCYYPDVCTEKRITTDPRRTEAAETRSTDEQD